MPAKRRYKYCSQVHIPSQGPGYGKKYAKCDKMNHFKEICRRCKGSMVHNKEKEDEQEQETNIEMVNKNSIRFHFNHSAKIANLKTSLNKVVITVPYKVDMGSDRNMPFYMFKKIFPRATVEQLAATKETKIKLKMYKQTTITQLGICRITLENINKCKLCNFSVVPGNRQALSCMPDIELLNILTVSCNTIGTEREDNHANCSIVIVPVMLEVSSTVQTQGWKGGVQEQTTMYSAIQMHVAIPI